MKRDFFFFKRKAKFKVLVAFERFSMEYKESMWNELNIVELRRDIRLLKFDTCVLDFINSFILLKRLYFFFFLN